MEGARHFLAEHQFNSENNKFTLATDLCRLGYLTFMDTLLVTTFIITGLVVFISYQLRRMIDAGKAQVARIDKYIRWFYPLANIVGIGSVTYLVG